MWGEGARWQLESQASSPHEAHHLKLDCSKARSAFGWRPLWDLEKALAKIVEWHKLSLQGGNLHAKTLAQVREYQEELQFKIANSPGEDNE
jgi:CDP-glucose 4,6-dehydratase